jgi:hypothetical protein
MRKQYTFSLRHVLAVSTVLSMGLAVAADASRRYQSARVLLDSTDNPPHEIVERAEGDFRIAVGEISLLIPVSVLGLGWLFIEFSRRPAASQVFPILEPDDANR